jgi:hypothetical protein
MDIMNNMTVSTSKLTFSLIAISALLISGSGFLIQDAYATNAPEFSAIHWNTTATKVIFDHAVNGTLRMTDWHIMTFCPEINQKYCSVVETAVDGSALTSGDIAISNIYNGSTTPSAKDILQSGGSGTKGFINDTTSFFLIHAAIPTGASYYVNFTNTGSLADTSATGQFHEYLLGRSGPASAAGNAGTPDKVLKIGSNATGADYMTPTFVSADILKSNAKRIQLTMSEDIHIINSTIAEFTLTKTFTSNGLTYTSAVTPVSMSTNNQTEYLDIELKHALNEGDIVTITYDSAIGTAIGWKNWISDGVNSGNYTTSGLTGTDVHKLTGHGNRLLNFTATVTNWLEIGQYGDLTSCNDCSAPTLSKVQVSLDSSTPVTVNSDNHVQINAGIGDTVSVMVTVNDNMGADTIPFAGLYTNFGETPDNLFYANNFDNTKQMSTSYYEWNYNTDDIAFDNDGAITWSDATTKVNPDRTKTFTYTMTINDSIESSQVWVDLGDKTGNYAKLALPITLEVSGPPSLTFASDDSQKVVSFFNESILLAIVSQWTATSSDDASNVEQLSSVLGIESQLPTWTTELASWVADDKIDVADMIVAVEYVINL